MSIVPRARLCKFSSVASGAVPAKTVGETVGQALDGGIDRQDVVAYGKRLRACRRVVQALIAGEIGKAA